MPVPRGSEKFQCSSTKRWGVSAWVSMTRAEAWSSAAVIAMLLMLLEWWGGLGVCGNPVEVVGVLCDEVIYGKWA